MGCVTNNSPHTKQPELQSQLWLIQLPTSKTLNAFQSISNLIS